MIKDVTRAIVAGTHGFLGNGTGPVIQDEMAGRRGSFLIYKQPEA